MRTAPPFSVAFLRMLVFSGNSVHAPLESSAASQALSALEEGVAVYSLTGESLYRNLALTRALEGPGGGILSREVEHFAASLVDLIAIRDLSGQPDAGELEVRKLAWGLGALCLRGSYIDDGDGGVGRLLLIVMAPAEASPTAAGFSHRVLRLPHA